MNWSHHPFDSNFNKTIDLQLVTFEVKKHFFVLCCSCTYDVSNFLPCSTNKKSLAVYRSSGPYILNVNFDAVNNAILYPGSVVAFEAMVTLAGSHTMDPGVSIPASALPASSLGVTWFVNSNLVANNSLTLTSVSERVFLQYVCTSVGPMELG